MPQTRVEINCDTVAFSPHSIPIPKVSTEDYLQQAAGDIINFLTNPIAHLPYLHIGDTTQNSLLQISQLLTRSIDSIINLDPPQQSRNKYIALPRVEESTTSQLPRVRRSNHIQEQLNSLPPLQALYAIPTPKLLLAKLEKIPPTTTKILSNLVSELQTKISPPASTPKQHALNSVVTLISHYKAFHAFLHPHLNHIYDKKGKKQTLQNLLKGPKQDRWLQALSNEFGRLAQGNNRGIVGTDTIKLILKSAVPSDKKVTYASFVCDHRPLKEEQWRIRCVVGGDKLPYDDDPALPAASLLDTKIMINSTISDAKFGARFLSPDLKDHFLASPMKGPEYMKIPLSIFPSDIVEKYNLNALASDGQVYIKIKKGIYGLNTSCNPRI